MVEKVQEKLKDGEKNVKRTKTSSWKKRRWSSYERGREEEDRNPLGRRTNGGGEEPRGAERDQSER